MLQIEQLNKSRTQMGLTPIVMKEERAARIHKLLKNRDEGEQEIAKLLREELDAVGEPKWLEWCEKEFGWKRSAAYNHLNPEQLRKDRERAEENRQCPDHLDINSNLEEEACAQKEQKTAKQLAEQLLQSMLNLSKAHGPQPEDIWFELQEVVRKEFIRENDSRVRLEISPLIDMKRSGFDTESTQ